jgi:hypothetical protein
MLLNIIFMLIISMLQKIIFVDTKKGIKTNLFFYPSLLLIFLLWGGKVGVGDGEMRGLSWRGRIKRDGGAEGRWEGGSAVK